MSELETLQAIAGLGLLPHHVQDGVDQLRALSVVALGPVVPCAGLTEDEVVWGGGREGGRGGEGGRERVSD